MVRFKADIDDKDWPDQVKSRPRVGFQLVWTAVDFKPKGSFAFFRLPNKI